MNTFIKSLFFLLIIGLTGCESMVTDVEAPSSTPKLVITGFLSPESNYSHIKIYMSRPLYSTYEDSNGYGGEGKPEYKSATVTLSDGVNMVTFLYNDDLQGYYVSKTDFPIVKGQTYYLKVTAPGGYLAESSCTVPVDTPPDIEITDIDSHTEYETHISRISGKFRDIENEGHYYRVAVGSMYESYDWWSGAQNGYIGSVGFQNGENYVSDKNKDSQYFSFKTYEMYRRVTDSRKIYLYIAVTDVHYYNYHISMNKYEGDNPFSEPMPMYSNIIGGLGVFCAYNQKITEIQL